MTGDASALDDQALRRLVEQEMADRIDTLWHAIYSGELDEKGSHTRVETAEDAAWIADEGVEWFIRFTVEKVRASDGKWVRRGQAVA